MRCDLCFALGKQFTIDEQVLFAVIAMTTTKGMKVEVILMKN